LTDRRSAPNKGLASYYSIGDRKRAAWSYPNAWPEVGRVRNLVSFEPDKIDVYLDDKQLKLEPGQHVVPHGVDRGLDPDEILHKNPVQ
jgi:nucleotidyltransferase-like protein